MKHFQNILFVVQGSDVSELAIKKAVYVSNANDARLSFIVLHSTFPKELADAEDAYKSYIQKDIKASLEKENFQQTVKITFETQEPHFVTVIQSVLKNGYDLIIKSAETSDDQDTKGFKALNMSLLRKCPCPVWLCRDPFDDDQLNILTAVDPFVETPEGQDLNKKLLDIGKNLAELLSGKNSVISCWDLEHENFLRNSPFSNMKSFAVDELIQEEDKKHNQALQALIQNSNVNIDEKHIFRFRGKPYKIIPDVINSQKIDIIVMGTVARTGIPGFIIGNTAENLLQQISCGMFAVKPNGFISPIKAY